MLVLVGFLENDPLWNFLYVKNCISYEKGGFPEEWSEEGGRVPKKVEGLELD